MKVSESKKYPDIFTKCREVTLFNYNIKQIEKEMVGEEIEKFYQYNYIEIRDKITRKNLIDALIRAKYDVNDEFNLNAKNRTSIKYKEYRTFIEDCKKIVDEAMGKL